MIAVVVFACLPFMTAAAYIARGFGKAVHELRVLRMNAAYCRYLDALDAERRQQR